MRAKRRETLTAQGSGRVAEPYLEIVEPIHVATTYERGTDGSYPGCRVYSRADNPTYDAREVGAVIGIDSTVATPLLTRPIELGASIVMHSATKYLNGHSDVIAGALAAARDDALWQSIRYIRGGGGSVLGPFESWLLLRGIRTLHLRVACACSNAMAIAQRFERHPKLSHVLYPGLASNPGHAVAARQMSGGFGGMISLRLKNGEEAANAVTSQLLVFYRRTSLFFVLILALHR